MEETWPEQGVLSGLWADLLDPRGEEEEEVNALFGVVVVVTVGVFVVGIFVEEKSLESVRRRFRLLTEFEGAGSSWIATSPAHASSVKMSQYRPAELHLLSHFLSIFIHLCTSAISLLGFGANPVLFPLHIFNNKITAAVNAVICKWGNGKLLKRLYDSKT